MSRLKHIREQAHLTQEELSAQSGISVRTIQRIEAGTAPKGHTLKTLAKALGVTEKELLNEAVPSEIPTENIPKTILLPEEQTDYSKIKLINLSSILFVILPPLNILAPLLLSRYFRQKNTLTRQIISLQIFWTLMAPIAFMLGIFLKLGRSLTLVLMIVIILSDIVMILRNTAELDKKQKLYFRLNFSII